jgi:hypothetical protein
MAYKSILTILTETDDAARVLDAAISVASAAKAHIWTSCVSGSTARRRAIISLAPRL